MKKLYFLFFTFLITSLTFGQTPIITMIADGDCSGGTPKVVEIYADGIVDFSLYSLQLQTNANTSWGSTYNLADFGTVSNSFIYVFSDSTTDDGAFTSEFPSATDAHESSVANFNGDDRIRIIEDSSTDVIDQYGVSDTDGTGQTWEYTDGYAKRNDGTGPDGGFIESNWTFYKGDLDALGVCQGGTSTFESIIGSGSYSTTGSTEPTLALVDTPPSGSTLTLSPEDTSGTLEFVTTNFTVATPSTGDGYIKWSLKDGSNNIVDDGNVYDISTTYPVTGMSPGNTYTFFAELVDNSGNPLSTPVNYTLTVIVKAYNTVANLATLRAGTEGEYYHVTGEIVGTFAQAYRNQKYAQDATAGILVDDNDGVITTVYNFGDGITGLKGQLTSYNGILEIIPTVDPGAPSSTGNSIVPEVVSLSDIAGNLGAYESELVKINGVTFADGNGSNVFATGTNYDISDGTASVFRTAFFDADYIGELIPTGSQNIIVLVGGYNGTPQVTSRDLADLSGTLGLRKDEITGFNVFPNPVNNGKVYIYTQTNAEKQIMIYNILGKQVMMQTLKGRELNVSSLRSGVYILKVMEDGKTATRKLIIN